jgi:pyruvate, orthophosphate dikinase
MHSILNVGINDEVVEILAEMPGANRKFALDTYQRFLQTFGCNVLEVDSKLYDDALKAQKIQEGVESETDLSEEGLEHLVRIFKLIANVPQDPMSQFWMIIQKLYETMKSLPLHLFDLIDLIPPLLPLLPTLSDNTNSEPEPLARENEKLAIIVQVCCASSPLLSSLHSQHFS